MSRIRVGRIPAVVVALVATAAAGWGLLVPRPESRIVMATTAEGVARLGAGWTLGGDDISATLIEYRPDGRAKRRFQVIDGVQEGIELAFHEDGSLSASRLYRRGRPHGTSRGWWPDGTARFECPMVDGQPHGTCQTWYTNGKPATVERYAMGEREGLQQGWSSDGVLQHSFVVRDGRRYGTLGAKACFSVAWDEGSGVEVATPSGMAKAADIQRILDAEVPDTVWTIEAAETGTNQ